MTRIPIRWTALWLMIVFGSGCAYQMQQPPERAQTPAPAPRAPLSTPDLRAEALDGRIARLEALLENGRLGAEDRFLAQDLVKTYQAVERVSAAGGAGEEHRALLEMLLTSLLRMEEHCLHAPSVDETGGRQALALFSEKRKTIVDSYLAGDHQGVVDECIELERVFGPDSLTPEVGLLFALSLGKRGMVEEALRVGALISDDLERKPGFILLRAKMIEWQLALGDRRSAIESYGKLVDNMHEREAVLKTAERNLSGQVSLKTPTERPGAKPEEPPVVDLSAQPASVQEALAQVEALLRRNDYKTAKLLLLRLRIRLEDGPDADLVDQAMKSVELAEEKAREQQTTATSQREEALELAANLIEQEKFEEAIAELESLGQGQMLSPEAKQLQDVAVEKIVNRERNKAAKLFLMAKNTTDPVKKKELLVNSHNLLKALVEKYPSSSLYQKINDNMKRIEEELSKLRSTALPSPSAVS